MAEVSYHPDNRWYKESNVAQVWTLEDTSGR